jgi:tRNA dimethylallyltransferase
MEQNQLTTPNRSYNKPVVFILGPTGIGKTKISLHLSKLLKGEIINSDAFSLYKGADILTTKATFEERNLIPHHMIDILDLEETGYKILDYIRECSKVVENLLVKDKETIPVIVGGTNYYVQSLLFDKIDFEKISESELNVEENHNKINENKIEDNFSEILDDEMKILFEKINLIKINSQSQSQNIDLNLFNKNLDTFLSTLKEEKLLHILKLVDPGYYTFLHKNDTRRIKNAIIYFFAFSEKKSEKISKEFLKLKYPNSFIVFLNPTNKDPFYSRLESRVDEIINENGLVEIFRILVKFYSLHGENLENLENQFDKGILQAIGYKEFFPLFSKIIQMGNLKINKSCKDISLCTEPVIDTMESVKLLITNSKLDSLFQECRKKHISNTVKYAKSQLKFIKNRILPYVNSKRIIEIKISEFTNEKYEGYINEAYQFIREGLISISMSMDEVQEKFNKISLWEKFYCEICKTEMNGNYEYDNHLKSNKHKKKKRNEKFKLENEKNINSKIDKDKDF